MAGSASLRLMAAVDLDEPRASHSADRGLPCSRKITAGTLHSEPHSSRKTRALPWVPNTRDAYSKS
jgi:hypothetical protein